MYRKPSPIRKALWILVLGTALALVWVLFLGRMIFPLPYYGPYEGIITDAVTSRPIPGAVLEAVWSRRNLPFGTERGRDAIQASADAGDGGLYHFTPPKERGGLFDTRLTVFVRAKGYIEAVYIQDPHKTPLPSEEVAWPFTRKAVMAELPPRLDVALQPAMPVLIESMTAFDPLVRQTAAEYIGKMGPEAANACKPLLKGLRDKAARVRLKSAWALGELRLEPQKSVPALADLLKDQDRWTVREAAQALGKFGTHAKSAVPALIEALNSIDPFQREEAARALGMIGPSAKGADHALRVRLMDETNPYVRANLEEAIRMIGPK